jgi:hypothetical protein
MRIITVKEMPGGIQVDFGGMFIGALHRKAHGIKEDMGGNNL